MCLFYHLLYLIFNFFYEKNIFICSKKASVEERDRRGPEYIAEDLLLLEIFMQQNQKVRQVQGGEKMGLTRWTQGGTDLW